MLEDRLLVRKFNCGNRQVLGRVYEKYKDDLVTLVQDRKDPAYYGDSILPEDADRVLMRWKISDDQYRVIFGDLTAENVSSERLAELEKQLGE